MNKTKTEINKEEEKNTMNRQHLYYIEKLNLIEMNEYCGNCFKQNHKEKVWQSLKTGNVILK